MTEGFIKRTAFDYDMEVFEVEKIADLYPEKFYEKLEEFILDRANTNNRPFQNIIQNNESQQS